MRTLSHAETAVISHIIAALPERFAYWRIHQKGMPDFDVSPGDTRAALRSLRRDLIEKDGPFIRLDPRLECELSDVIAAVHPEA